MEAEQIFSDIRALNNKAHIPDKFVETELPRFNIYGFQKSRFDKNKDRWLLLALKENPAIIEEYTNNNKVFRAMWFGEFSGKLLMSIAYAYAMSREENLRQAGNELVEALMNAQKPDGYLGPFTDDLRLVGKPGKTAWDFLGHYHNIMALYYWYTLTNDVRAKKMAFAALDYIISFMSQENINYVDADWQEMNLAIGHAFAFFYNLTKNEKYLKEALRIVQYDWEQKDLGGAGHWDASAANWYNEALAGKDFYKNSKSRWEALHSIMTLAELYKATGDQNYLKAFENIWWSIRKTDIHNNGSFSSNEGASNGAFINTDAIETCCTIAWMEYSVEYLKIVKNSYIADELELSNFNAVYGSQLDLSEEYKQYYAYDTPMDGAKIAATHTLGTREQAEVRAPDVSCCQLNGPKGPSMIGQWGVMQDEKGIYLNYYGQSEIFSTTHDGNQVKIKQNTEYPVGGLINISVLPQKAENFNLYLRVPCWSAQTKIRLNGELLKDVKAGSYYCLARTWSASDRLELELDMQVHFLKGESYGQYASAYYGPILLAQNSIDITEKNFTAMEFNHLTVKRGKENWIDAVLKTKSGSVMLHDFASVGKGKVKSAFGNSYRSWLPIRGLKGLPFGRKELPKWCERACDKDKWEKQ